MSKRAAIYARVSTDEQAQGYSLATQLEACRVYCEEHGFEIVREFADDYTGTSLDRPELDRLRDLITNDAVGAVVVYDLDRLARKAVYQMLLEEEFKKAGARVCYVQGDYADNDEGQLMKTIKAAISEYERAKILERSRRGLQGKAKAGYVIVGARPPYGYQVKSEPHKNWLIIDEDEAKVVRLIFEWYVYGDGDDGPLSVRAIARRLTTLRIPTRGDKEKRIKKKHGRCVWHHGVVNGIRKNETYTGVWHYNKNDCSEKQRERPRDEWIEVAVPAIIDRALWEEAQARAPHNTSFSSRNTKWHYLLRRRLTCVNCGRAVSSFTKARRGRKPISYYRCDAATGRMPGYECHMPHFRGDQLEPAVWEWVSDLLLHPDQLTDGLRAQQAEAERANQVLRDRLVLVEESITDHDHQIERLLDLYLTGDDFPKELLDEKKARLTRVRQELEKERGGLVRHLQQTMISDAQVQEIEEFCRQVSEGLGNTSFEDKRKILELLNVRGQLAIEDGQKVVYVSCVIDQTRLPIVSSTPWC